MALEEASPVRGRAEEVDVSDGHLFAGFDGALGVDSTDVYVKKMEKVSHLGGIKAKANDSLISHY